MSEADRREKHARVAGEAVVYCSGLIRKVHAPFSATLPVDQMHGPNKGAREPKPSARRPLQPRGHAAPDVWA
jgi:hypothetical protein